MKSNVSSLRRLSATRGLLALVLSLAAVATTLTITESSAQAWTGWGEVPGGGSTYDSPAVSGTSTSSYVFVRGTDNRIYVNHNASGWSGWSEVPGDGRTLSAPAVETLPNQVFLFVRGTDNAIYMNTLNGTTWSGWSEVPGGGRTASAPAVALGPGGTLHLAVRSASNRIYYNRSVGVSSVGGGYNFSTWTGWSEIPGGGLTPSAPAIRFVRWGVSVFVRGTDNGIYENTLNTNFTGWSGWGEIPGGGRTTAGPAAAGWYGGGVPVWTYLVVQGTDGRIYDNTRSYPGGSWTGWREIPGGGSTPSAPAAFSTPWNVVYVRGTDNKIYGNRE